jgi:IPTL-CTERM motif
MRRVKPLIVSVALIFGVISLYVFSHTTNLWAYNQCNYIYEALLDTDDNESTGSNGNKVMVVQGAEIPHPIHGIDYIVRVEANICGTSGQELGPIHVLRWNNNSSDFGSETNYLLLYHLGFENSDIITSPPHHADVIEFEAFKADIGSPQGRIKVIYHASQAGSVHNDYTGPLNDPPLSIPTLSQWGIIVLSLLLGIFAFFMMKKQKKASLKLLCVVIVLISVSGIAWAFCTDIICLNGEVDDWNNLSTPPLSITDQSEDSSAIPKDMGEDILKGYLTSNDTKYFFRIDVAGGGSPAPPGEE